MYIIYIDVCKYIHAYVYICMYKYTFMYIYLSHIVCKCMCMHTGLNT